MIKRRILLVALCLLIPASVFAQKSKTDKSWNSFWRQFSAAVNKQDKAAVKRLTAAEKDFSDPSGGEKRDEWLQTIEREKLWGLLQKSVAKGTVSFGEARQRRRTTKDGVLVFRFIGGRWRFAGPGGD